MTVKKIDYSLVSKYEFEIGELLHESYSVNFQLSSTDLDRIVKDKLYDLKRHMLNNNAFLFGKFDDENLIGFVWFFEYESLNKSKMHINQIIVHEDYRGQGFSKELLRVVENTAKKKKIKVVDLYVSSTNEVAEKLYKNKGYKVSRKYLAKEL